MRIKTADPDIIQYKNGVYYYFGKPKGSKVRIERSLKTCDFLKAVEAKVLLLQSLNITGNYANQKAGALMQAYVNNQRERLERGDIRENSFVSVEWCMRLYLIPFFKKYEIGDIDNDAFSKMRSKYGRKDYKNHRKHLVAFLSWCREQRLINHVPKFDVGKWSKRQRLVLTKDEIIAVLANSHGNLLLFVSMYLFMGMRSAEITRLRWDWIDTDTGSILLPEEVVKTGKSRDIPINRFVFGLLVERRKKSASEWVFPNKRKVGATPHMTDGGFNREWAKMLKRAGITRPLTPHDLRATFERYAHINPNFTDTQREKMVGASAEVQRRVYLSQFSATELRGLEEAVHFDGLQPILEAKKVVGNDVGEKI